MYKYSCRKCPIRNRCIDESFNADSIKVMIRRAFEARTDTLATWGRLQKDCLLVKAEKEKRKAKTSPLTLRLQKVQASKDAEAAQVEEAPVQEATKPKTGELPPKSVKKDRTQPLHTPDYLQPVAPKRPTKPLRKLTTSTRPFSGKGVPEMYWVTIDGSDRHILLPDDGALVFGRFDPNVGIPPDIDLAFEDRKYHGISRRHASLQAKNNKHTVEDLGSKSGVFLNDEQISYGPSRILKAGDTLRMGNIQIRYDRVPAKILQNANSVQARHVLKVTPTGRKIHISPPQNIIIGRTDARVNFVPDIDLSRDGEVAKLVSRRHAIIQWRNGQPFLEDLGSGFGTRLRGELLSLGRSRTLRPGDHIWLAGCVLAYDIEL